jgi:hypothetical protein
VPDARGLIVDKRARIAHNPRLLDRATAVASLTAGRSSGTRRPMAAKKPTREKSAARNRAPAPKKTGPASARAKEAKRLKPSEKNPFEDLRFLPFVPIRPASRATLDRINAMAERINAALVPVVWQLRKEATTEQELEDVVRLLHQLFASNCGRFEAMLVVHRLSLSANLGFTDVEMKLLGDQLGDHFSDVRCRVFDASFQQFLDSKGREDVQPKAVADASEAGRAPKPDDTVH